MKLPTALSRFLCLLLVYQPSILGNSIVYNFRIAQITKQSNNSDQNNPQSIRKNNLSALIFNQYQEKYNKSRQNFTGEMSSYIQNLNSYYFRIDFAFAHIKNKVDHKIIFSKTQTDDLLFTAGKNFKLNSKNNISLSGLIGIPTHQMELLLHPEFGYGQIGAGLQLDGSSTNSSQDSALIYGARYLYFAPRNTFDELKNKYKFTTGNTIDLLVAAKHDFNQNGIEAGYSCRFQFGTKLTPNVSNLIASNYISSNFYLVYKHRFLIKETPNRFLANIAYGFNHKKPILGNRMIITAWVFWGVNF